MTTWTSPATPEQKRYYSKRKGKLQAYGIAALAIQLLWAYFDFPAYVYVLDGAFQTMPDLLWTTPYAAFLLLATMHYILRETYTTYWFDKLDNDEKTDSSIAIPIVLMIVLFFAGRYGIKMSIEAKLPEPEKKDYNEANQILASRVDRMRKSCAEDTTNVGRSYTSRISAATLSLDTRINALKKRQPTAPADQKAVKSQIRALTQKRADIVAPLAQARANEIGGIVERFNAAKNREDATFSQKVTSVDTHNQKADDDHESTLSKIGFGSWMLSLFFVVIYCALGYAIVSIKVKSGILPIRDHTVLDQYGGPIGRLLYVLQDAFNRQVYRFSIGIHRVATLGTSVLHDMDATYQAGQADYHQRQSFKALGEGGHPISDDEARQKVIEKAARIIAGNPGYVPAEDTLQVEFLKAKAMNGTYMDAPWGGSTPSASAVTKNAPTVPQSATTVAQQKQEVFANSPDDVVRFHHMELQKEPSNFKNPQALRQTVLDRVVKKLVKANQAVAYMQYGDVSGETCSRFRRFLYTQLLPHLTGEEYAETAFTQLDNVLIGLYDAQEGEGA